jgi:hypothetical protein
MSAVVPLAVLNSPVVLLKECLKTGGCITVGDRVAKERPVAGCRVVPAAGVAKERVSAAGGVEAAGCVVTECSQAGGCVEVADSVVKEGEHSIGRVVRADSVGQKCADASCRVRVCGVGKKRPSTDSRVEVADEVALK